ncbi:putative wall-associated receptor kinase [Helianthus anomalus]
MKLFQAYLLLLLFFSLTVTPPAIAKYAKIGCSDRCGNVMIPFPFGIGAKCSINQWYIVDCKNSRPYLPALNNLEVLRVNLVSQTVTVSTPRITDCQNPVRKSSEIMGVDLGGSPFWFSKPHNKFVLEGCGMALMVMENGSVATGCSTACLNVTTGNRNNCFGNGCCQMAIPQHLKSYSINITGLEEGEGACGSAFLVEDETSYVQADSPYPFLFTNTSFTPVSLLWTLTDSDQLTCCNHESPQWRFVDMFDGTRIDTWKCDPSVYFYDEQSWNPYLTDGCKDDGM